MSRQPENVIFLKENAYFENFSKKVLTEFFKVLYSFVLRTNRMNHPGEIQRQTDPCDQAKYSDKLTRKGQAKYNCKSMAQPSSEIQRQTGDHHRAIYN